MQNNKVYRGNNVPQGGATPPTVGGVAEGGMLMPDTLQLQEMADLFYENSEQNYLQLNNVQLTPGSQTQFKLQNVGLGEGLELMITGEFDLVNSGATEQSYTVAPEFPYNIISNLNLMFNGKVSLVNASGYELLTMMMKRNQRNTFVNSFKDTTGWVRQEMRVDNRIASLSITGGSSSHGDTLTGIEKLNVPANTTARIQFGMYLDISFILRKDIPIGLIPMQHNSVYANVSITTKSLVGDTADFPFMRGGAIDTEIENLSINVQPTYNFWGLPSDVNLYSYFVNNSYVVTTYPKNPINNVGEKALSFNFPLNYWLVSALFTIRKQGGNLANIREEIEQPYLMYNGTIIVDKSDIKTRIAREILATGRQYPYGCLLFDGAQTNNLHGNSANMAKWLNMYQANNPVYYANVQPHVSMPGSFDVLLEQIVPNYVTVL